MHYGFIPPSSPTPHGGALRSLIPSSPSRVTLHRNRLDRASSSAGHVTAAGLTTWKRRPRKDSSDDESGKRGLGMGMKGTPGRRKKPRKTSKVRSISHSQVIPDNEQSLGIQSTPKGSSSKPPSGSGSSSSFPLSDLPDSEDTTHDTLSIFGHPEVSSPAAEAIPGFTESEESDGLTMTLISSRPPSSRELHDDQQHTETLVTLFPDVQDVLIPLNDVSEPLAGSHRRRMRSEDLNALINELPHPDQVTAVMAAITHEDFTVPVNDEALSARTPVSNQPASKLIGRQSTPYVWRKKKTVLVILNDENSVADEDEIELGRGHSPQTPQARDRSESPGDEERAVTPRHDRSVLPSSDNDMAATELDEQGKYPFEPESLDDPFLNPVEEVDSRKSTRRVVPNPRDSPDIACQRYCTPGPEEATLGDPFGFDRVQQLLQEKQPRPFQSSSELATPARSPSTSTIIFSRTPSQSSVASSETVKNPGVSASRIKSIGRSRKGVWRGAEVLSRMEAGEAEQGSQHANGEDMESNDEGSDDSTRSRRTVVKDSGSMPKKKRKAAKKREASILVESESAFWARQARIQDYLDLEKHYKLHVELVLW